MSAEARERFGKMALTLEAVLRDRKYLVGDAFGVADVMVGATLAWARAMRLVDALPSLEGYLRGCASARPGSGRWPTDRRMLASSLEGRVRQ